MSPRWLCLLLAALGPAALAGCSSGRDPARYVPADNSARSALKDCLDSWRAGEAPGEITDRSPRVHLVDTHHRPGQRLVDYAVLGPAAGERGRCYSVRLVFERPREEVKARFVVLGIDPLWVLRYEDYEMLAHWDHPPPAGGKPEARK
jgi:hypothetical protein